MYVCVCLYSLVVHTQIIILQLHVVFKICSIVLAHLCSSSQLLSLSLMLFCHVIFRLVERQQHLAVVWTKGQQ